MGGTGSRSRGVAEGRQGIGAQLSPGGRLGDGARGPPWRRRSVCPGEPGPGPLPPGSTVQGLPWGAGPSDHAWPGPPLACLPVALRDEHHSQGRGTSWDRAPRPVPRAQTDTWLRPRMLPPCPQPGSPTSRVGGHRGSDRDSLLPPTPSRGRAACRALDTGVDRAAGHSLGRFQLCGGGGWCLAERP